MNMKRNLALVAAVALLAIAVPALSDGDDEKSVVNELLFRIEALEKQTVEQQLALEQHQQRIERAEAWIARQDRRHAHVVKLAVYAQKKGFLYPAPNIEGKGAILDALHALDGGQAKLRSPAAAPLTPDGDPFPPGGDE